MAGGEGKTKIRFVFMIMLALVTMLGILEGKCPKCGTRRIGLALRNPRHQTCPKCGTGLEITNGGRKVSTGYSPFTAEKYLINPPTNIPSPHDKEKDQLR